MDCGNCGTGFARHCVKPMENAARKRGNRTLFGFPQHFQHIVENAVESPFNVVNQCTSHPSQVRLFFRVMLPHPCLTTMAE